MGLVVVEIDEMVSDIGQLFGPEIELAGGDVPALGPGVSEVGIDGPWPAVEGPFEFHPVLTTDRVVEWRQDDRRAELALIDQILRRLVVGIDAQGDAAR